MKVAMRIFHVEIAKFLIVGAINFFLTFALFTLMLEVIGVSYIGSLVIATFVGLIFSYICNFTWVFDVKQKSKFRNKFKKFLIANSLSLFINILILSTLVENFYFEPLFAQFLLVPFIVAFIFSMAKFWWFKMNED